MIHEYEVKVLDLDVESIRSKLKELGAQFVGSKMSRRYVYDFSPVKANSWVRLRDEGGVSTLCIKEILDDSIEGTKELETVVSDFDATHSILEKLGYSARAYQENKRESWALDGVRIEIDFWPMIPAYLEIEADSKQEVDFMIEKLGVSDLELTSENTNKVYARYGINLHEITDLRF